MRRLIPAPIRAVLAQQPWAVRIYQLFRPPPELRVTQALDAVRALQQEYGLAEAHITPTAAFFASPTGAEFAYVPAWGAYGAERATLHEEPELRHCAEVIPNGALVFDVGANVGTFAINLAVLRPDLRFHAFEPVRTTYDWLVENIVRNDLTGRITPHRLAVSDRDMTVRIRNDLYTGNRITTAHGSNTDRVRARPIDDLVRETGDPQFIKADVEGAELHVVLGARQLLARSQPMLLLEVVDAHLTGFGASARELEDTLTQLGYMRPVSPRFKTSNRLYVSTVRG